MSVSSTPRQRPERAAFRERPMVKLQPQQFDRTASLFDADLPNRRMLESVLAGRNPGWVFADRAGRPGAAVVVSHYSFTYLGGRPDRELLAFALARSPVEKPVVICTRDTRAVPPSFIADDPVVDRIEFVDLAPTWSAPL